VGWQWRNSAGLGRRPDPAENPVILLVEDAQYADTGLLDFLDHLMDWVRDLPVYVLVFARPELGQAHVNPGHARTSPSL